LCEGKFFLERVRDGKVYDHLHYDLVFEMQLALLFVVDSVLPALLTKLHESVKGQLSVLGVLMTFLVDDCHGED
jgi:hypothetical protein